MAEIAGLLEILLDDRRIRSDDLRSSSARLGLERLVAILLAGLATEDSRAGFEAWNGDQVDAVIYASRAVVSAVLANPGEPLEPLVLATIEKSLDFSVQYLEKSSFAGDDFSLQNRVVQFMHLSLETGVLDSQDVHEIRPTSVIVEGLSSIPIKSTSIELGTICFVQGFDCPKENVTVSPNLLTTLSSEFSQPNPISKLQSCLAPSLVLMTSAARHFALVHIKYIPRLLKFCHSLLEPPSSSDKLEDSNLLQKLSFGLKTLKLLKTLVTESPGNGCDTELLRSVASYVDSVPPLFKLSLDLGTVDGASFGDALGSILLQTIDELMQFVNIAFYTGDVCRAVEACLIASVFEILSSKSWRYEKMSPSLRAPLVCSPRVVQYLFKLVTDSKRWISRSELDTNGLNSDTSNPPSCRVRYELVFLLEKFSHEDLINLVFPTTENWMDDLINLVSYLHTLALKSAVLADKSRATCTKPVVVSDTESVMSHDDEALFGDLFAEASRSSTLSDVLDQPVLRATGSNGANSAPCGPIQALTDLFTFLKTCTFSPDWYRTVYEDACAKVNFNHINLLLSILDCHNVLCIERNLDSSQSSINELCFDLLRTLVASHECPFSLKQYLVDQILGVEHGVFLYNHYSLALVAHILVSGNDLGGGDKLRSGLFKTYMDYIVYKVNDSTVITSLTEATRLWELLPCAFHSEILIMAFHLSSPVEKQALADLVFSTLKKLAATPPPATGLSVWALFVSRIVLLLKHMVLYPLSCPPWFLSRFRSKLREVPYRPEDFLFYLHDCFASLAFPISGGIFGNTVKGTSVASNLLPQLFDAVPLHVSFYTDGSEDALQNLGLDLYELIGTVSTILGFWKGKRGKSPDDLMVERYLFVTFWSTLSAVKPGMKNARIGVIDWKNLDFSDNTAFLSFSLGLIGEGVTSGDILGALNCLHSEISQELDGTENWEFLRKNSWLSLLVSLLHTNSSRFVTENKMDSEFIDILSSILEIYLGLVQSTFLSSFDQSRSSSDNSFSTLLLVKHTAFDKAKQDLIHNKVGFDLTRLETIYNLLPKLEGIASKFEVITNCLFHGFPEFPNSCSGTLLSCVLSIKEVVCAIDVFLKVMREKNGFELDASITRRVLGLVMAIKTDKIFSSVHPQCDTVCSTLIGADLEGYKGLFTLKQLEQFLAQLNSEEGIDCEVREMVISSLVTSIDELRKDGSKADVLKFYIGSDEGVSREAVPLFGTYRADLLVLIDALDKCQSEALNLKVIGLFVDILASGLCPSLKEKLRKKFLAMDTGSLSNWLEARLLGGTGTGTGSVRESTVDFLMRLTSPLNETWASELQTRLGESVLVLLDTAFLQRDLQSAEPYFNYAVKLVSCEPTGMKSLLENTLKLMEKMVEKESLLPGLKFLLTFFDAVFGESSIPTKPSLKSLSSKISNSSAVSSVSLLSNKSFRSLCKNPESEVVAPDTVLAKEIVGTSSGEEDDDDGTTDGDFDREEEEDSNSERALASKVCTFTSSGSNFMEQHWYFCYTCDLTISKGCCSVCARVCHKGHRVVYSRSSRFFCDCGAGGARGTSCQCLKPRKFTGQVQSSAVPVPGTNTGIASSIPYAIEEIDEDVDSGSDLDDDVADDGVDRLYKLSLPKEFHDELPEILDRLGVENQIVRICDKLLPGVMCKRESNLLKDKRVILGSEKKVSYVNDLFSLKKAFKSGSMDLKIKSDYPNSRDLKSHLSSGSLTKSLLSVSVRGKLAVGEGDKIAIFDIGQLIGQPSNVPVMADKTNVKPLSRNMIRFEIVHLSFNPLVENYVCVAGYEECQVLTVNSRGEVTDRLAIELALQGGAYLRKIEWVPGSQVQLMVASNMFVKIYDLSQDNISPVHYFTLENDSIVDATLVPASMGKLFLLVLSESGILYRFEVSMEGDVGAKTLTDAIHIEGKQTQSRGVSLYFSSTYRLLFIAYQDGTSLLGRLDSHSKTLAEISFINEEEKEEIGTVKPAALHHWRELIVGTGVFCCQSGLKSNAALCVSLGTHELNAQNMKHGGGNAASAMVGVAAYTPLSKDKTNCLIMFEDGSLHIFAYTGTSGEDVGSSGTTSEQKRKLGPSILIGKDYTGTNPEFPVDFFEKTMCISPDVKLICDTFKGGDSETIKQRLTSDDGYLEGPNSSGFKVTVTNPNQDIVMVGCRIHVGTTSSSHVPSELTVFQRTIKLDEGFRSWYDIPFTTAESLLADEEFTIAIGPTFDKVSTPRIDFFEIYGRSKDEFGWKEKMDEVLNLEASVLTGHGGAGGSAAKRLLTSAASSIQEQVLADALKILARVYVLCGSRQEEYSETGDAEMEIEKLRCKDLLETVFQSDHEPLLQLAACRVLQAVFPKRETYYHVKDTMRLLGVIKSFPIISSRIGCGGATSAWVLKEFIAQIQAVSKITLSRRANMASFLLTHGSEVVDGLMEIFWGILNLERPDTHTINTIVVPCVDLIYSYAECLASIAEEDATTLAVAPAVSLLKQLLFAPYEAVQTSSSLAISSRLLQVPFPKQTMIAAIEDAAHPVPSDTSGQTGNTTIMVDEDPATTSVQYCCDGCSTVPIARRRWHCTVCPDFDLCDTCYQVLGAEQLPDPHARDHPMKAIPIELDSVSTGDGTAPSSDVHFSLDDSTDPSPVPSSAVPVERSSSSIHVLETADNAELASQRIVSISAAKRAVNSLLLRGLIEELNGWMEGITGTRALPVMQFFYRLSSALGGPFMDGSKERPSETLDLERFVKWLLDEIDITKPFPAKARSSFGEVAILVFMFFTLMFRNWHQPGGSGSDGLGSGSKTDPLEKGTVQVSTSSAPAGDDLEKDEFDSQLANACSYLRNQGFLDYLMEVLQQLESVFKSAPGTEMGAGTGPGCGSLLTVRRELPAGNFSPFFSDSYAKSHSKDLFADYHKLLLENTFRLVYSMVRPEKHDKSSEKDVKTQKPIVPVSGTRDLKLDGHQDILCSYISNPNTNFVRRYARRLFLHVCGSKTHYYSVRDAWQYSHEVKRLHKIVNKSGGFKNPVPYERSVKLIKCLSTLCEVAQSRPKNWQKYCLKNSDLLPFLTNSLFYFGEESVIQGLKLLNLALYTGKESIQKPDSGVGTVEILFPSKSSESKKKRKGVEEAGESSSSEKSCMDMELALEMFSEKDGVLLGRFVETFLLQWSSASVRNEAKCVLYGMWYHAKAQFKESMLNALLEKVRCLPMYGQNIVEYTDLMAWLLAKGAINIIGTGTGTGSGKSLEKEKDIISRCLTSDAVTSIYETLHAQNELLANHPNSRIYNTLSSLVEFDGYYLESEPCVSCSCPDVPYSRIKLETLKSETKYTDNRIIVKCTGCFMIQSITMNIHDARKSKSVKVLNLYYNNRPVADLSELKNNWSLWKRAKSCHLAANQTELKVEFPIPITACNLMIELDSFYENLQAFSLESLQCPRCSRSVTDKHGICGNCHENAYQCRQCRNINYENLDSFLCNECGYSKFGRFEFHFMAKPSFSFDNMENDEDMKKGLAAIETESENAHRRYQQLLGFKKPLVKLVSSIGEHEMDSQQKDTVQQMMISLPGPSCKVNRKIALLGVLYGEKCKAAFDSVSKSVQTLQGLRRVLMAYLHQKGSDEVGSISQPILTNPRSSNNCYGCATTFVTQCLELLQVLAKHPACKKQLISAGILSELFENNIHMGPRTTRVLARSVISSFSEGDSEAVSELNGLIKKKITYCLEHHRSMDIASATREELSLLSETCALVDDLWESRLRIAFQILFSSIKVGAKHPAISENIILPCLKIVSQACTPPRSDPSDANKDQDKGKIGSPVLNPKSEISTVTEKTGTGKVAQEIPLLSYSEWERGATYLDFVRRQYKVSSTVKTGTGPTVQRSDYLALKYGLRWKRRTFKRSSKSDFSKFALGSWISELILSACSQSIRSEVCTLINLLFPTGSSRQYQLLNLLMNLLPATLNAGESAGEYFELFFNMVESEETRLFLTVKGCLGTICKLITNEVSNVESQERSLAVDISQGFILHKLIELLNKFLEVPNIRTRFMRDELLSEVLEAFLIIRGLVVQKTKLITDCTRLLKELLDSLVLESTDNKRQFIRACVAGLQKYAKEQKRRTSLFILEQLCNMICPSKPEPVYLLILNKAHTQEEFIRGSMTKNPYLSTEIGPLMRDVKNKICHQLDLMGLVEDDYGMELLVAGNIISLDLSIPQVFELVWKKHSSGSHAAMSAITGMSPSSQRDTPPMTVTYRLQGLDGEATEPMIKELEEEREESQDPEVEFAIAGAVRECGGLEIILSMIQRLRDEDLRSNQEELGSVLNLLKYCCKIHENRCALLQLGALGLLLETARRAFSVDSMESAEGILLIVESLTIEANKSDISITQGVRTEETTGAGEQSKKIVVMFLERLCHPVGTKRSNKQQRNDEMVTRILPYLTYGEPAAMDALIQHFEPYLTDWARFDQVQKEHVENLKDENLGQLALGQRSALENFVRVSESLNSSSCGEGLKDIILEKGITKAAVTHLRESFGGPESKPESFKNLAEWAVALKLPSVPLILSMLRGLSKGHLGTQNCIDEQGVLPLFHALESVVGENEIGVKAENLLDTLANKENNGDGFLGEKIDELRHTTKDEMRRRALKKRETLLKGLGMRQELGSDGGKRIVVSQPSIEGLDDVEEETNGLACMVCREGYTLRPNDILGVYSFSKRVNLGASGTTGTTSRGDCVYTTVSHFNIIHFQCHQEAKRADAALKNPKREWDGATLRNNETLCNCIFPLRGPAVPLVQYARCVDQYWENLSALGRADGSRLRLLTYDIVLMLARFATGAPFNVDARGGGRESNSRFLPFMVQMGSYMLDQGNPSFTNQRRSMAKLISSYLSSSSSSSSLSPPGSRLSPPVTPAEETVQYMMVNSLLSNSYEEWVHHRPSFIQRGIYHAYMQRKQSSSTDLTDNTKLLGVVQPMLVYTGLIEQMQKFFKVNKKSQVADEPGLERWEVVMRERMGNMSEMVGFSKDMLDWLEDMTTASDLQEAFDVMGALEDVFSRGFTQCEEFVRSAITAGKN